jgi:hypothetical protein
MMLETALAQMSQQFSESGDLTDRDSPVHFKRIVSKLSFANIALDSTLGIVSRNPEIGHGSGAYVSLDGSETVFPTQSLAQHVKLGYLNVIRHKTPGKVAAMSAHAFVFFIPVIVVPVQETRNFSRRK